MNAFKMRSAKAFKFQSLTLTWRLLPCTFLALLCLYYFTLPNTSSPPTPHSSYISYHSSPPPPPPPPPPPYSGILLVEKEKASPPSSIHSVMDKGYKKQCDYFNGKWVPDRTGPLYNGTTCRIFQESFNCMNNGRPDSDYLYWRWKPRRCPLPRFKPNTFLQLVKNKHIAFVGDSLGRNQLQSLLCMLSSVSTPKFLPHEGSLGWWHFPSHNATISSYWTPFLVKGVEISGRNTLHLDQVHEGWARDMDQMDLIVLAFGHWFVSKPSVYYEGGSVLGCRNFPNCTDIGINVPLRKALRTALNSIIDQKTAKGNGVGVIVRTFTPSHFEGTWDKGGTCLKTTPYKEGEKKLEQIDAEIRKIGIEELQNAKEKAQQFGGFKFKVLDVTKLALMRPDGHPGAYMNPFPFAKGVPKIVQNDCSHWCVPGPIDTWNEIFLEMIKKWEE